MTAGKIEGIIPVMITPFTEDDKIDYDGVENLIEWYIRNGADGLFSVCQSSEMLFLSAEERRSLGRFVVEKSRGRLPVVVSGHINDDPYSQMEDIKGGIDSGADGLVLVTNHLDPKNKGSDVFLGNLKWLLSQIPKDIRLGLYECPVPYRRLLSQEELRFCIETGRFSFFKDVSCDLGIIKQRLAGIGNSNFALINANAAIAWKAIQAGSKGFTGVHTNIHPELYKWLYQYGRKYPETAAEVSVFLAMASLSESYGYPVLAKIFHQRLGTFKTIHSRVMNYDVREKVWAIDDILDKLSEGSQIMKEKIEGKN
jgi:4-hydroxy-tetrahydrodipicolinate synthase